MMEMIMTFAMAMYNAMGNIVDAGLCVVDAHPVAALMVVVVVGLALGITITGKKYLVTVD